MVAAARQLADQAMAIEGKLMDIHLTDGNEDLNRHPSELYQKLTALYDKNEADLGPTASDLAVNATFKTWMAQSQAALAAFDENQLPAFNALLKAQGLTLAVEP